MLGPVQNREPVLHLAGGNQPSSDLVPLARSRRPRDYVMFVQSLNDSWRSKTALDSIIF
jgi:hypothetical protein